LKKKHIRKQTKTKTNLAALLIGIIGGGIMPGCAYRGGIGLY